MSYNIGNYVVYCSKEICRIESKVKKCFNGVDETEYFKLIPIRHCRQITYPST